MSSEARLLDCQTAQPEVLPLPAAKLFTTYSQLKSFVKEKLDRESLGRVTYHPGFTLLVRFMPELSEAAMLSEVLSEVLRAKC